MANQVIDSSIVNALQSDINEVKNNISSSQLSYEDGKMSPANIVNSAIVRTSNATGISVYTATIPLFITKPLVYVPVTPKGYLTSKPVVTATIECSNPPGAMTPVVTNIDGSNQIAINVYTSGTIAQSGVTAYLHVTVIGYA